MSALPAIGRRHTVSADVERHWLAVGLLCGSSLLPGLIVGDRRRAGGARFGRPRSARSCRRLAPSDGVHGPRGFPDTDNHTTLLFGVHHARRLHRALDNRRRPAALLLRRASRFQRSILAALIAYAIGAHNSNGLLMAAAVPIGIAVVGLRTSMRDGFRRSLPVAAAVFAGIAALVLASIGLRMVFGRPVQNPPFALERIIADGPGLVSCRRAARPRAMSRASWWIPTGR